MVVWERPGMVLGGPWRVFGGIGRSLGQSEKSKCFYFVGFRWFSEMSCFLMFFDRYLKATLFSSKAKSLIDFILIQGGGKCCYFVSVRYDCGNIRFFTGAFSMNSF